MKVCTKNGVKPPCSRTQPSPRLLHNLNCFLLQSPDVMYKEEMILHCESHEISEQCQTTHKKTAYRNLEWICTETALSYRTNHFHNGVFHFNEVFLNKTMWIWVTIVIKKDIYLPKSTFLMTDGMRKSYKKRQDVQWVISFHAHKTLINNGAGDDKNWLAKMRLLSFIYQNIHICRSFVFKRDPAESKTEVEFDERRVLLP
jgi:hypothetical protein